MMRAVLQLAINLSSLLQIINGAGLEILACFTPCSGGFTGNEVIPGTGCSMYHECWKGKVQARNSCGSPLIYDARKNYCNFPSETSCPLGDITCPKKTVAPTSKPIISGANNNNIPSFNEEEDDDTITRTIMPIADMDMTAPTENPSVQPTTVSPTTYINSIEYIEKKRSLIEEFVLVSYRNNGDYGKPFRSNSYMFDALMKSLQIMAIDGFGADFKFNLWEKSEDRYLYGLVNLAAFLANAMVESIEDDTCDELSWEETNGRHAISNSCGQQKRSYQDDTCDMKEDIFSCDVNKNMQVTAVNSGTQVNAPPPLQCKPKDSVLDYSGYWDTTSGIHSLAAYSNSLGRTDIEGCCWWGRGALMTRGVCNIGKMNYYLGKRGAELGRSSLYPTVDFCQNPEATCNSIDSQEMRWTVAIFEWAERVQRYYKEDQWSYEQKLVEFVDNGMVDGSFIDSASRILSHGCHETGCSYYDVRKLDKRRSNFNLILNTIFRIKSLMEDRPQPQPALPPTMPPTRPVPIPTTQQATFPPVNVPPQQQQPQPNTPIEDYKPPTDSPTYSDSHLIELEGNGAISWRQLSLMTSLAVLCVMCM